MLIKNVSARGVTLRGKMIAPGAEVEFDESQREMLEADIKGVSELRADKAKAKAEEKKEEKKEGGK
jgi:hypothetical protein